MHSSWRVEDRLQVESGHLPEGSNRLFALQRLFHSDRRVAPNRARRRRSGFHFVLKSNQKPVIASQMMPNAITMISG